MKFTSVTQRVGNTPITKVIEHGKAVIWAKEEGSNPTGSLKDRTATGIIQQGLASGKLTQGKELLDASSGSYACALAFFAQQHGIQATVVVNSKISNDNLAFLKIAGATIIQHGDVTGEGREYCVNLVSKSPEKWFFTDQLTNMIAPLVHEETTAPEIFSDMDQVTAIIASKGSGATLCGITRYVAKNYPETKVFGSIAIAGDEKKIAGTYLEGVDFVTPFITELETQQSFTGNIPVTYKVAMQNVGDLLKEGVLAGPQGGGVLQAAKEAIDMYNLEGNVIIITGDTLLKNVSRF
jgi:cysteine synthase